MRRTLFATLAGIFGLMLLNASNYQPFSAGDDLQSSGLLGPVTLYML